MEQMVEYIPIIHLEEAKLPQLPLFVFFKNKCIIIQSLPPGDHI